MSWTTFYGRKIEISNLSHQHLSNIHWYFALVLELDTPFEIEFQLRDRFGGMRLPYSPMISFTQEIEALKEKGYIDDSLNSNIVVNGKWVGALSYA